MNFLDQALTNAARTAKFGAVGDRFSMQVSGQGTWTASDWPTSDWLKQLLTETGYNITDAQITLITANPIGFAYGSRYSFWFKVDDELGTGNITDAFNQLTAVITPFFDDYTASVTNSTLTPIGTGGIKSPGGGLLPGTGGGTTAPGTKKGAFQTIADDLKIPLAALGIIGVALVIYFEGKK